MPEVYNRVCRHKQYMSNTTNSTGRPDGVYCFRTVSYAVDMTTRGTPGRMIRIDDEMWDLFDQACAEEGTTRTDDLRRHIHSRVRAYCKAKGIAMPKIKPRIVRRQKPAAES